MVMDLTDSVRNEIPVMIEREGIPSFKVFMAYKGVVQADDETLLRTMLTAGEHGGLTMVHAENGDAVYVIQERFAEQGKLGIEYWPESRPPELEAEAAHRAIVLAGIANAPLYIVHVSSALAVDEIAQARSRGGQVYGETCPQYLVLSKERYLEPGADAARYVMAPPLRDESNQEPLWQALASGSLQVVATDHSAWPIKDHKDQSLDDFRYIIQGAPGIETRLPVLYTYGVAAGRMTPEPLCRDDRDRARAPLRPLPAEGRHRDRRGRGHPRLGSHGRMDAFRGRAARQHGLHDLRGDARAGRSGRGALARAGRRARPGVRRRRGRRPLPAPRAVQSPVGAGSEVKQRIHLWQSGPPGPRLLIRPVA